MNHVKVFKKAVVDEWQFIQYQGDVEAICNAFCTCDKFEEDC